MKKAIITLAITTFITGALFILIQPSNSITGNSKDTKLLAKDDLFRSINDSLDQYNSESDKKIGKYEQSIKEFKSRIANEKNENNTRSFKKLAEIDR